MKDFHVGMVVKDDNNSEDDCTITAQDDSPESNHKNGKFKRIARQVAQQSSTNKWRKTIEDVCQ